MRAGLAMAILGGFGLVASVAGDAGLAGVIPSFFCVVAALGFTAPNATALALADHGDAAGSAAALLGAIQFGVGAIVAPLPGIAGEDTAVPLAVITLLATIGAMFAYAVLVRPQLRGTADSNR
jgi:DHA1 family bicyclomycin/chloramphenicol resistance-like MFS transporter